MSDDKLRELDEAVRDVLARESQRARAEALEEVTDAVWRYLSADERDIVIEIINIVKARAKPKIVL